MIKLPPHSLCHFVLLPPNLLLVVEVYQLAIGLLEHFGNCFDLCTGGCKSAFEIMDRYMVIAVLHNIYYEIIDRCMVIVVLH